jgi:hypothetical protein
METLNPLGKDRLQVNGRIREHILGTTQGPHGVVVDVQPKAVEAQENTHPVQVRNDGIPVTQHPIKQVVHMGSRVIVSHHENGCVGCCPTNQEAANPHVVGKQPQLGGVVRRNVRIGRHRVHVLSHDDG